MDIFPRDSISPHEQILLQPTQHCFRLRIIQALATHDLAKNCSGEKNSVHHSVNVIALRGNEFSRPGKCLDDWSCFIYLSECDGVGST